MGEAVLVVDDNPVNMKLAAEVLEHEGYRVYRAVDASSALDILARSPIRLVLMDIEMPGTDGLTLTRMIKAAPAFRRLPIIALTASAMLGDEQKAIDAGCDGYITKPINTRELGRLVERYLGPGRTERR